MEDNLFSSNNLANPDQYAIASQRVQELLEEIDRHNTLYYNDAQPVISDSEFDSLLTELKEIEAKFPDLVSAQSPTQRVGGAPLESFEKVQHPVPMLSIEDIHELKPEDATEGSDQQFWSLQNLDGWFNRINREQIKYSIEPKIDGVAISLMYQNGTLIYAATRGDGTTGDDVTQNVKTISSIPTEIKDAPTTFEVRGEIFMTNDGFIQLNQQQEERGEQPFKNPRNATAGTLKQLDSTIVAERPLDCIFHSFGSISPSVIHSISQFQELLTLFGLQRSRWFHTANTLHELKEYITQLDKDRHSLPYATDGAVIKVNDTSLHEEIGYTSKFPKWACAFKYLPNQVETTVLGITIQVGRTGVLTPVAELEPIDVSGTTVSRATLHNQSEITTKDIRIGDQVVVEKAGEIIPAVVKVLKDQRTEDLKPFNLLKFINYTCPACNGEIEERVSYIGPKKNQREVKTHFCTNFQCPAQAVTRITHFTQRKALDIEGVGTSVAEKLIETKKVLSPLELFKLDLPTLANLMLDPAESKEGEIISKERRFGEKRAEKVISALERARHELPLSRWIFGIGIANIGESTAKELSRLHQSFLELSKSPILETLIALAEFEEAKKECSPNNKHKPPTDDEDRTRRKALFEQYKNDIAALKEQLTPYQIKGDLGSVSSYALINFFNSEHGAEFLNDLSALDLDPQSDNFAPIFSETDSAIHSRISGKTFVITGTLTMPRDHFKQLIEQNGGSVAGSISKKTDFLLAGEKAGSKKTKAESLGIQILDEDSFQRLLDQ